MDVLSWDRELEFVVNEDELCCELDVCEMEFEDEEEIEVVIDPPTG